MNGHELIIEPNHDLPLVHCQVVIPTGALADPDGQEGLSRLVARMLRRGTQSRSTREVEEAIDAMGAELGIETGHSHVRLSLSVIRKNLEPALALLGEMLASPALDDGELAQLVRETQALRTELRDNDQTLAAIHFRRAQYGAHPYGRTLLGTARSLDAITPERVRSAWSQRFARMPLWVGFAGDIRTEEAERLVDKHLPPARQDAPPRPAAGEPHQAPGRRLRLVDKPERSQTQIYIGRLGTHASDPDHFPLMVANAVFGGTFTSRLMREVRSERGWSYGASARLGVDRVRDTWNMWTFPAASDAAACIRLQLELMERWVREGVTAEELEFVKSYLVKSYAFAVDTAEKRMEQALDLRLLDLPPDYFSRHTQQIQAVTLQEANAALPRRLDPADLTLSVVATAAQLRDALAELPGVGEIQTVPYDAD